MAVTTSSVAGIIAGLNPLVYSASAPYTLFLFQAVFIILLCSIIHIPLSKLQQPRVIAEVITGILLGPSVMGHVPNFTTTCFSAASIPSLTLFANIGIILFLFIIGLEVDVKFIIKNAKAAVTVGLINMAVPFALGCGIAKGFYEHYRVDDDTLKPIDFTTYMVFIAVALCITAFPVLARILTELNLIGDRVGTIVLAAGITNDLVGWILLALAVTLANASDGINTLYILLLTVAWFLFLSYPVRLTMKFLLKRYTTDLQSGEPSQISMMLILVLVFISAFYTDIIGVHPIFGAFMVGVIVPRDNGYVIKITEKLEDLVHIVMIPIYFALAGLSVNLGDLSQGIDWAYTIGIILLAMFGKISGGFFAAKLNKLLWRESLAVGILMSCKGIVEIVVLNVGLNSGIISQKVYSMFIVMALVTTFLTTPLALLVYPVSYREKRDKFINGEIEWDGTPISQVDSKSRTSSTANEDVEIIEESSDGVTNNLIKKVRGRKELTIENFKNFKLSNLIVLVKSLESISSLMNFVHDFASFDLDEEDDEYHSNYEVDVKAIHLREFSSRTSHLLEASQAQGDDYFEETNSTSSLLAILRIFTNMLNIHFTSYSILAPTKNHLLSINEHISNENSNFLMASVPLKKFVPENEYFSSMSLGAALLEAENSDISFYKKLFHSASCSFGLLLTNGNIGSKKYDDFVSEKPKARKQLTRQGSNSNFGLKSINLILNHENVLTESDLLALNVVFKLGFNLARINVFVKSSPASRTSFDQQIEKLFNYNSHIDLSIHHLKDSNHFADEIQRIRPNISAELFVIANNIAKDDIENIFDKNVNQLLDLSASENFDVLIVKAAQR
ncbi:K(+)/H(+) antiporter 1 [[Candida] railenensis]|uniref:K(+)/H(+) antiporter 1 n=1 Tax=[Candida] railenensis TaxID=45579 RepID=A0A9P0QKC4_9ASCO|nr:K(+)/H(+) antiporter 1 [[Candida] railenensis]